MPTMPKAVRIIRNKSADMYILISKVVTFKKQTSNL